MKQPHQPSTNSTIPFNWPYMTGKELHYIAEAHRHGCLAGDGPFTKRCHELLEAQTSCVRALLTHSCTAALEMSALLAQLEPGDEVIVPSYTFVSTANAFVLQGAVPVFVDVSPDTLNIDHRLISSAITNRTRAIVVVHYAGVACEMDEILAIARQHNLLVIEDAAQGVMAKYRGRALGTLGDLGAFSFHETKNIISGEGGCLLLNRADFVERAEILREKGTNRSRFFRGQVDKYTWQDVGSSFLPGELIAAFLYAQLEEAERITAERVAAWNRYHLFLASLAKRGLVQCPTIPPHCSHNGHLYYIVLPKEASRDLVLAHLKSEGVNAVFHYVPLHSSPGGQRFGRTAAQLTHTERISERLIRLPLWIGITAAQQERVVTVLEEAIEHALEASRGRSRVVGG